MKIKLVSQTAIKKVIEFDNKKELIQNSKSHDHCKMWSQVKHKKGTWHQNYKKSILDYIDCCWRDYNLG